jgi:hypothetical protein
MSVRANENLYPKFYPTDLESLQQLYRRHTVFHLLWDTPADRHLRRPGFIHGGGVQEEALRSHWRSAIARSPASYLHHRWDFYLSFLGIGIGPERGGFGFHHSRTLSEFRTPVQNWVFGNWAIAWLHRNNDLFLFRSWFYLALLIIAAPAALVLSRRVEGRRHAFSRGRDLALAASGLAYLATYFFAGVASDFKYSWWAVIVSLLLTLRVIALRFSASERAAVGWECRPARSAERRGEMRLLG